MRYLRATKFKSIDQARDRLVSTLNWRASYRPNDPTGLEPECACGKVYWSGFDKWGQPMGKGAQVQGELTLVYISSTEKSICSNHSPSSLCPLSLSLRLKVYMVINRPNTKNYDRGLRWSIFVIESAIKHMPPGVERVNIVIDNTNMSKADSTPMSITRQWIDILANHYPEVSESKEDYNNNMSLNHCYNIIASGKRVHGESFLVR